MDSRRGRRGGGRVRRRLGDEHLGHDERGHDERELDEHLGLRHADGLHFRLTARPRGEDGDPSDLPARSGARLLLLQDRIDGPH